ncbi:MAG: HYR domain-containing protein, partial [Bacteroidota bacterium]
MYHRLLLNSERRGTPSGSPPTAGPPTTYGRCRPFGAASRALCGLLLFVLMLFGTNAQATHYAGGDIQYTWITGNTYRVTKKIYRDCFGVSLGTTSLLQISPSSANGPNVQLTRISITDITPLCPGQISRCASTAGTVGIEEHIYEGNVSFNPLPGGGTYTLSATLCCRNNAINTLTNPGSDRLYLESTLNANFSNPGNSSPAFLNVPIAFLCAGQPATISPNAFDPDGDALVYSLTACRSLATQPVSYGPGFSATNPLTTTSGITVDGSTGLLSFTPATAGQVGVICILVEEFRAGNKIGQIIRDIQVQVQTCNNAAPVIDPITNFFIPVGQQLCVPVNATDADNDNITLSAVGGIIPPATFQVTSSTPGSATGLFCFTPTLANAGQTYTITINAQDDACPAPGASSETFNITIPIPCTMAVEAGGTPPSCAGGSDGTASVSIINGTPPFNYTWVGPNNFQSSAASPTGLIAGTYCVVVQDGNSCVDSSCVTLTANSTPINLTTNVTDANCGQNNGSIMVVASGGAAPYSYSLNGGTPQASNMFNGLAQGSYTTDVTDNNGCTAAATASVGQAIDNTPPVIACPANIMQSNDPGICGAVVTFNATATDDCGQVTVSQSGGPASGSTFPVGSTTVTFTATDGNGNTASCSFTVQVMDNEAPNAICQNVTVQLDASGNASVTAQDINNGSTDNCGIASLSLNNTNFDCSNLGPNTVTLTVTDVNSNASSCTATVTVEDNIPPTAVCQDITLYLDQNGQAAIIPQDIDGGSSDNCGQISLTSVPPNVDCADFGQTVQAFLTVTDGSGNSSTCLANVTVEDSTAPTITCPPDIAFQCTGDVPPPDPTLVVATDNCTPLTYLFVGDVTISGTGCIGSPKIIERTYLVEDPTHNQAICTQTFTVTDSTAPVIDCPADTTLECGPNLDTSPMAAGMATAFDNCDTQTSSAAACFGPTGLSVVNRAGSAVIDYCGLFGCQGLQGPWGSISLFQDSANIYITTVLNVDWRIRDVRYKVDQESNFIPQQNGVWDTTAWNYIPYPVGPNGQQTSLVTIPLSSLPNCYSIGLVATAYKWSFFGAIDGLSLRPLWLYDPGYLLRNNPPATPFLFGYCTESCTPGAAIPVTFTDSVVNGCGGTQTITRTFSATDNCGFTSTCDQTITVIDNTPPTINCPSNITVSNDPGQCGAAVAFNATGSDGCGNVTISYSQPSGSVFPVGTTTVTATATDDCNNTTSCTFDVTVNDTEDPTIMCPADVTVSCITDLPAPDPSSATANDNCPGVTVAFLSDSQSNGTGCGSSPLVVTRTYQATDGSGNTATCTQTITVVDSVPPVITCPADVTVECGMSTDPSATGTATATDDCAGGGSTLDTCSTQLYQLA